MNRIFSLFNLFFPASPPPAPGRDVAYQLMERAEARAGRHPYQAQELRQAAQAYLRVVR